MNVAQGTGNRATSTARPGGMKLLGHALSTECIVWTDRQAAANRVNQLITWHLRATAN